MGHKGGKRLCYYCHQPMARAGTRTARSSTWDHLTPTSRGGTSSPENKVRCCRKCNNEKGDMTEAEYQEFRRQRRSGFFAGLTFKQQRAALEYRGPEFEQDVNGQ